MYTLNDQKPGVYCKTSADGEYQLYRAGEIEPHTVVELQLHNLAQPEVCANACGTLPWREFGALKKLTIHGCNFTTFALQDNLLNLEHIEFVRSTLDGENARRVLDHAGKIKKLAVSHCTQDLFGDENSYEDFLTRVEKIKQDINSSITTPIAREISSRHSSPLRINTSIKYWRGDQEVRAPSTESDYAMITKLSLSHASEKDFDQIAFAKLTNLKTLRIHESVIQDLRIEAGSLPNLETLELTNCVGTIQTIDSFIEHCPQLHSTVNAEGTQFLNSDLTQDEDNVSFSTLSVELPESHSSSSNSTRSSLNAPSTFSIDTSEATLAQHSDSVPSSFENSGSISSSRQSYTSIPTPVNNESITTNSGGDQFPSPTTESLDLQGSLLKDRNTRTFNGSISSSSDDAMALTTITYWRGDKEVRAPSTESDYARITELSVSNASEDNFSQIEFAMLTNLQTLRIHESDIQDLRIEAGSLQNLSTLEFIDCLATKQTTDSFIEHCPQLHGIVNTEGTVFVDSDLIQDGGEVTSTTLSTEPPVSHSISSNSTRSSFSAPSPLRIDTSEATLAQYSNLQGNSVPRSFKNRGSISSSRQSYTSLHTPSGGEQFLSPTTPRIVYWIGAKEVPAPIVEGDYAKITELYISNASQKDFDQIAFAKLEKLQILSILESNIQDLRVEKGGLQNLVILDFTDCMIASKKTIDNFIENCPRLNGLVNTDGTQFLDSDLSQDGDSVAFPTLSAESPESHPITPPNSTTSSESEEIRPLKKLKKVFRTKQPTDDALPQSTPHAEADDSSIKPFDESDLNDIGSPLRRQKTQEDERHSTGSFNSSISSARQSDTSLHTPTASTPISPATIMYWNGKKDVNAPTTDHEYADITELLMSAVSEEELSKIAFTKLTNLKVLRIYESDVRNLRAEEGSLQNLKTLYLIDCVANEDVTDSFIDHCPQLDRDHINTSGTQFLNSDLPQDDSGVASPTLSADSLKRHSTSPNTTGSSFSAQKTSPRSEERSVLKSSQSVLSKKQSSDARTTPSGDETDMIDDNSVSSFATRDLAGVDAQPSRKRVQEADDHSMISIDTAATKGSSTQSQFSQDSSLSQDRTSPKSDTSRQHDNVSSVSSNPHSYYASSSSKTSHYKEKLSNTRTNLSAHGHSIDFETWISTPRNSVERRSLAQIEKDIKKALVTQCLEKHDDPLNYEIKQHTDSSGDFVKLSYEAETLLVADTDSVAVYKTWNKHQTLDLSAKAMIVLGSLGIPPCPKEGIEFETGETTPLGEEVVKQLARLQEEPESDTELKINVRHTR